MDWEGGSFGSNVHPWVSLHAKQQTPIVGTTCIRLHPPMSQCPSRCSSNIRCKLAGAGPDVQCTILSMPGHFQGHFVRPQSTTQFLLAWKHVPWLFSPLFSNGEWETLRAHCQLMLEKSCFCENTIPALEHTRSNIPINDACLLRWPLASNLNCNGSWFCINNDLK